MTDNLNVLFSLADLPRSRYGEEHFYDDQREHPENYYVFSDSVRRVMLYKNHRTGRYFVKWFNIVCEDLNQWFDVRRGVGRYDCPLCTNEYDRFKSAVHCWRTVVRCYFRSMEKCGLWPVLDRSK